VEEVTRTCIIPEGKAILFPIINVQCDYANTPEFKTESDLRECTKEDQDKAANLQASIDGIAITDLSKCRVTLFIPVTILLDFHLGLLSRYLMVFGFF
jgi:hypothetical protein